ncbi:trichohyalin [Ixodes scapularis]
MTETTDAAPVANDSQNGGSGPTESLSLPLREDFERKRRLALERRKEYNDYLSRKEAEEEQKRQERLKHGRRKAVSNPLDFHKTKPQEEHAPRLEKPDHRESVISKAPTDADDGTASMNTAEHADDDVETRKVQEQQPQRQMNGLEDNHTSPAFILREETSKLKKEREEFARLEVVSAVRKPATRDALTGDACRSNAHSPTRSQDEKDGTDNADQAWERSQSLDRGRAGLQSTQLNALSLPAGLEKKPQDAKKQLFSKESYLKELEAQIREKKERMLREKEEEVRLDRKCIEEYHDPWSRDLAVVMTGRKRPRFLGDLVRPVETSSDIMPSKARSESNLLGNGRQIGDVSVLVPELHLLLGRRADADAVPPRLSRKVHREALPPDVYSQELQKQQMEEKKQREEEQRLKDAAEEEKLEKRVEEQRLKMYQEYNEERKRGKGKDLQVSKRPERAQRTHKAKEKTGSEASKKSTPHHKSQKPISITRPQESGSKKKNEIVQELRPPRKRSESRDRMAGSLEILRRQLATEQQISRIQQMQKNYVVGEHIQGFD